MQMYSTSARAPQELVPPLPFPVVQSTVSPPVDSPRRNWVPLPSPLQSPTQPPPPSLDGSYAACVSIDGSSPHGHVGWAADAGSRLVSMPRVLTTVWMRTTLFAVNWTDRLAV